MGTGKTLYILRHAKAETGAVGLDDHERALNTRGVEAAQGMGEYLVRQGVTPDKVLCSTAIRARQTWEQMEKAYEKAPPVEYTDKLYLASANETLQLLAEMQESMSRLLIVGHNPGFHQLCIKLAKTGDEELFEHMIMSFPTCALTTIALDTPWREIGRAKGELKGFMTPKMLA